MRPPGFFEGVLLALAASLAGSILHSGLASVLPAGTAMRLLITGMGLGYALYLMHRSGARLGRVTSILGWVAVTTAGWILLTSLTGYLLLQVGLIWLIRSLYFHSSLLAALLDLLLQAASLAAALWAVAQSGSLLAALWCFFLTQALFTAIPPRIPSRTASEDRAQSDREQFSRASRAAESALRKMSSFQ